MQSKNDLDVLNMLDDWIHNYYRNNRNRPVRRFLTTENKEWGWRYLHYIVDRKHVFRYGLGQDRETWVGSIELGIGPAYFGASDFWSYENSKKFRLSVDIDSVQCNLKLLDEFFETSVK